MYAYRCATKPVCPYTYPPLSDPQWRAEPSHERVMMLCFHRWWKTDWANSVTIGNICVLRLGFAIDSIAAVEGRVTARRWRVDANYTETILYRFIYDWSMPANRSTGWLAGWLSRIATFMEARFLPTTLPAANNNNICHNSTTFLLSITEQFGKNRSIFHGNINTIKLTVL